MAASGVLMITLGILVVYVLGSLLQWKVATGSAMGLQVAFPGGGLGVPHGAPRHGRPGLPHPRVPWLACPEGDSVPFPNSLVCRASTARRTGRWSG